MKIAVLISSYFPEVGGAQVCVHHVAEKLTALGHKVVVVTPTKGNGRDGGYDYEVVRWNWLLGKTLLRGIPIGLRCFEYILRGIQNKYSFDLWQVVVGYPLGVLAIDFFNKNHIPAVLRCSGEDIQIEPEISYGARLNKKAGLQIRRTYPRYDAAISIVDSITHDLLEVGVPARKIFHIPNGIDRGIFSAKVNRDEVRKELGIRNHKRLILTVGRNHPKKGFSRIPEIISILCQKRNDFVWLLVGKGNENIWKIAAKTGVESFLMTKESISGFADNERFDFSDNDLVRLYKGADLFVMPTLIEGCSNAITEAMASGLPIVSTDVPGVRDMVENGKTGLLSTKNDLAAMARDIERLFDDKKLSEKIRRNALAQTENLDWDVVAGRYIDVYKEIMRRKERKTLL